VGPFPDGGVVGAGPPSTAKSMGSDLLGQGPESRLRRGHSGEVEPDIP